MLARRSVLLLGLAAVAGLAFVLGGRACGRSDSVVPRTILLLTIDTLRRDHVGAFTPAALDAPTNTPRLDALARASLRFLDARTPVPLTLPAHVTMFSGLPPAVSGVRLNAFDRLPGPRARGFPLLAEALRAAGWRTGAFVSAEPLAAAHGLDQGFETYDDGLETRSAGTPGSVAERAGAETAARALAFLRAARAEERVFLWVHLFEPHAPYVLYAHDVRAADAVAGQLLDGLHAAGRSEDAAILLTSDHGEMLGELGERTHGFLLADAVLRVPFSLRVPGRPASVREDPVDLADVAPTLAGLAGIGCEGTPSPFGGRDLLAGPQPRERVRVAESLYAHHRYRWAQVVAAVGAEGTLVDTGGKRLGWLPQAPPGEPQAGWTPATNPPSALAEALGLYRAGEQPTRMGAAADAGGYGGAGPVSPFLTDAENGRLPDPYAHMARAAALDAFLATLLLARGGAGLTPRGAARLREEAEHHLTQDPNNPEAHYLKGLAHEILATYELSRNSKAPVVAEHSLQAEAAYGQSVALGRLDAETLVRWAGVNARGREAQMLDRLREWSPRVRPTCGLWLLKARLHLVLEANLRIQKAEPPLILEHADRAAEACREARGLCHGADQLRLVTQTCR